LTQVGDEATLTTEVADEHDRVALARLEHSGQREGFVGGGAGVPEYDGIAPFAAFDRQCLDRLREEGIGDVADDRPEQHGGSAVQRSRERMRSVAELARGRARPARASRARPGSPPACG